MTRLFRRGELKEAILDALGQGEPATGYAVMQALADAVGGSWQPSPGAIYPALLALEDAGLLEGHDEDGTRVYALTAAGRAARARAAGTLSAVAERAQDAPPAVTLGSLLDDFAATAADRQRRLEPRTAQAVRARLAKAQLALTTILDKENQDG